MDSSLQPNSSFETPPAHQASGEAPSRTPEIAALAPAAPSLAAQPAAPLPVIDPALYAANPASSSATPVQAAAPAVADDLDLIEKEWVQKAKSIVHTNRSDPHSQNKEMNKFKADYMKKRYNKDIKLSEA